MFLGVTGKLGDMDYSEDQRQLIGEAVTAARVERGWGKEEAARHAGISSITWKRVEDGLRVQDIKLRSIELALHWGAGSMQRIARGRPVVVTDPDDIEQIRTRGWADHTDRAIWDGLSASVQYAKDCEARGAHRQLVTDFIGDAVALLNDVGLVASHPEMSSLNEKEQTDAAPTTRAAGSAAEVTELPAAAPASASALASYARAHGVTPARVDVNVVHFAGGIGAEVSPDRLEARVTMRGHRAADLDATSPGALYDQVLQQVADWQADTSDVEDDELRKRRERAAADAAKKAARRGPVDPGDED